LCTQHTKCRCCHTKYHRQAATTFTYTHTYLYTFVTTIVAASASMNDKLKEILNAKLT